MPEPIRDCQILPGELFFHLPIQDDEAAISCVVSGSPENERVYLRVDRSTLLQSYHALKKRVESLEKPAPQG